MPSTRTEPRAPSAGSATGREPRQQAACWYSWMIPPMREWRRARKASRSVTVAGSGQHELEVRSGVVEVHQDVACLPDDPVLAGMDRGAQDGYAPGGVFDRGEHIGLRPVEQVDSEQVQGHDRLGLGTQEVGPARALAAWCGFEPVASEDLPHAGRRETDAEGAEFARDAPVAPVRVVAGCAPPDA